MNDWKVVFKKPTTWAILIFLVVLFFMLSKEAKAETAFELAPGTLHVAGNRYNGLMLIIEERWQDKYAIAMGLTSTWDCLDVNDCVRGEGKPNQMVMFQRVVLYKKFELGLGLSYWSNVSPAWNSHTRRVGYVFKTYLIRIIPV